MDREASGEEDTPESPWTEAMRRGDFEAAWRYTDAIEHPRRALEQAGRLQWRPDHLLWNGAPFEGERVLIRCNHGLGDTLQFLRFVPLVRRQARCVFLMAQPALLGLLRGTDDFGTILDAWHDPPPAECEVEIEVMELAYAFRCTTATLPSTVPYIDVPASHTFPIHATDRLRVGLLWNASGWDPLRSIPLHALDPLLSVPDIDFYSLQQEAAEPAHLIPLSRHTAAIERAAAAMLGMDLIITIDSMAAHLAGAVGCPVWVLLRYRADWRWMEGRSDSPWYPTMRLFRQSREGIWGPVVEQLADCLAAVARGSLTAKHVLGNVSSFK